MGTGRTLGQFPVVAEQVVEEVVAPLCRGLGPSDFQAAADGVGTKAFAKFILPAEALILNGGTFWFGADILSGNASAVGLAESVSTGDERDRFFVVHRHAGERLADIPRRSDGIGLSIGPFRIHIDQTHLYGRQRIGKITVAAITLIGEPGALRSPINVLFGLPDIGAPAAKAERLKAHRLEGDVACENHEVGPGDFPAILLLDRPEQAARLVEVDVVGPAIERRETLLTGSSATAAVADAVRTRAVPGHTNEKRPIVAEVGGPPLLRVGHQGIQVFDHRIQVERLELFRVIELLTHRIGQRGMLVQNLKVQLIWPPINVRVRFARAVRYWALRFG